MPATRRRRNDGGALGDEAWVLPTFLAAGGSQNMISLGRGDGGPSKQVLDLDDAYCFIRAML